MSNRRKLMISMALAMGVLSPIAWLAAQPIKKHRTETDAVAAENPRGYSAYAAALKAGKRTTLNPTIFDVRTADQTTLVATKNGNLLSIKGKNRVIADAVFYSYPGPGMDGRGLVLIDAPRASLWNLVFHAGNDDSLCIAGDCRGTVAVNGQCLGPLGSKSLIAYTNKESNRPGPIYGAAEGYAATFIRYRFDAAVRIKDGVYNFQNCTFVIGALGSVFAPNLRANFIGCDWYAVTEKPPEAGYWYHRNPDGSLDPCAVRVEGLIDGKQAPGPLNSRLYFANCRLHTFATWSDLRHFQAGDGVPHPITQADGPTLCRAFPDDESRKAGRTAYKPKGSVPPEVFASEPVSK